MRRRRQAFSLAELLVALALISVAILSVLALSISVARGNREGVDKTVGTVVASQVLERLVDQLRADVPPGTKATFWGGEFTGSPYDTGTIINNKTEYKYEIFARTVTDTSGSSLGGSTPDNRLKKVDITVYWWDSDSQSHQGYGDLKVTVSRLISEGEL